MDRARRARRLRRGPASGRGPRRASRRACCTVREPDRRPGRPWFRAAADEDREVRPVKARCAFEPVVRAFEVDTILAEEVVHDLELFSKSRHALACGAELEAVGAVLAVLPACSHAEGHAPARDLVRRRRRAGEHGWMPERRGGDERAELELRRARSEPGDRRPGVEDATVLVEPRDVVVGTEERLDAVLLACGGERDPIVPGHTLLPLDHEREPHEAEAYACPPPPRVEEKSHSRHELHVPSRWFGQRLRGTRRGQSPSWLESAWAEQPRLGCPNRASLATTHGRPPARAAPR